MSESAGASQITLSLLRHAQHVLMAVLLIIGTGRTIQRTGTISVVLLVAVALVAAWYLLGVLLARRTTDLTIGRWWLAALIAGWLGLTALSVDFVWLAFALFFLAMQMLPRRVGPVAVIALTLVAIMASAMQHGGLTLGAALGPAIGAAVSIVIMIVYRDLRTEIESRNRLLADLTAAQHELAAAQHRAGTLAERQRLAGEIHDTVAQSLSTIILLLRSAGGGTATDSSRPLDMAVSAAQSALDDTRRLIRALEPATLASQPLTEALRELVEANARWGIDTHLVIEGEPYQLATSVEVAMLRAAQEALANVRHHSQASRVDVTLTFLPDTVNLDVVDDGRGFDPQRPAAATSSTGVGLTAMRRRLTDTGGRLVIESVPGSGTALSASIPTQGESS